MSRAFVKEDDASAGVVPLPDRPISPHRNLVTRRGLRLIERKLAQCQGELGHSADAEARERAARELRYWTARRATAEVSEPEPEVDSVVFGTAVTVRYEDGSSVTFRIVGEDEADPRRGADRLDGARGAGAAWRRAGRDPRAAQRRGRGPGDRGSAREAE